MWLESLFLLGIIERGQIRLDNIFCLNGFQTNYNQISKLDKIKLNMMILEIMIFLLQLSRSSRQALPECDAQICKDCRDSCVGCNKCPLCSILAKTCAEGKKTLKYEWVLSASHKLQKKNTDLF